MHIWYAFFFIKMMHRLESVRGFKGGIKLSASLGKILWTNIKPETQKKIWMYQQVNDILMKEQGIRPVFNGL